MVAIFLSLFPFIYIWLTNMVTPIWLLQVSLSTFKNLVRICQKKYGKLFLSICIGQDTVLVVKSIQILNLLVYTLNHSVNIIFVRKQTLELFSTWNFILMKDFFFCLHLIYSALLQLKTHEQKRLYFTQKITA